jgi:hypothetical protein
MNAVLMPEPLKISPFYGDSGQKGKTVCGIIELFYNGDRINKEWYSSRKERSAIIERWRESIGTPYHSNEYYLLIKNDL